MTPIVILSGFLGVGKTTTLKQLLENNEDLQLGVIANDVASINIDAELIKSQQMAEETKDGETKKTVTMQLENGCLCCSSSAGLIDTIKNLLTDENTFDYIVVESTGVAEPSKICAVVADAMKRDNKLSEMCTIGTLVTVIDAEHFTTYYDSASTMVQEPALWKDGAGIGQNEASGQENANRMVSDLLTEQVESADVLLLNKVDCMPDIEKLERTKHSVACLNPTADLHEMSWGKIDPKVILRSKQATSEIFQAIKREGREGLHRKAVQVSYKDSNHGHSHNHLHGEQCSDECHSKEKHTHPWNSFVFTSSRPFHGPALAKSVLSKMKEAQDMKRQSKHHEASDNPFLSVVRSKGFVWLAQQRDRRLYWTHAGLHFAVQPDGIWDSTLKPEQQLVFIGFEMDETEIRKRLEDALISEEQWNEMSSS